MKKLAKNIVLMLTALFFICMATSCKKEEPAPVVNFNNPTAQYIESFLGKSADEFIKACEESGMMKIIEGKEFISYSNEINKIETTCNIKNNKIIWISYYKEDCGIATNKKEFNNFFNYLSKNNYAAFKGWNNNDDKNLCFKDMTEYKNSLESDINASTCVMVKSSNGVGIWFNNTYPFDDYHIEFASPEDEIYEYIKADAMSSCN